MKILFLVPYPLGVAPSQRFRFEQYFHLLKRKDYSYRVQSFLNSQNWQLFFKSGRALPKVLALLHGFTKRFFILFTAHFFDYVFIHREATPIGPPIIEWILAKLLKKKIIYDFDDAIWLTDNVNESKFKTILKHRSKVNSICRWSYRVSCGNNYLCDHARKFSNAVLYNPTTIDTENLHDHKILTNKTLKKHSEITIGWTGSHSTLKYLDNIVPVLKKLEDRFSTLKIVVIANQPPALPLSSFQFIQWRKETEIEDLLKIDIGIMPLPKDEWAEGKCGFKALQYMALEIPTVASPVGVNTSIITKNINGFLPESLEEWESILTKLIENEFLRDKIGKAGRTTVVGNYSVLSNSDNFISLFQ